ncbi:hypothetical protein KFK09_029200 [Dendrobium nobile]|uniref:Uncharacterized protein n=1 Tax=Dendrobium nobile TaxID=94219 RepID=A0A8T3A4K1_DENNO|nr:hypothetical protein KFK09_029200 [Dendrobium nobile]
MLRSAGKRLAPLPWRPTCAGFSLFSRDPTYAAPSDHESMSGTSTLTTRLALESGLVGRIRDIKLANTVDVRSLRDPQEDSVRIKKASGLFVVVDCIHLGCIPLPMPWISL